MNNLRTSRYGFYAVLIIMIAFTLALGATTTAPVSAAVGDWNAKIETGNGSARLVVHISQAADGKLTGLLDSPDQGVTGITIDSIIYKDLDLHFAIESIGSTFDGKINKDNSEIAGDWKQSGMTLPLVLKRISK
jgi:uncharacterized protein